MVESPTYYRTFQPILKKPFFITFQYFSQTGNVYMVESPTYYRAFQPILKTLQKMDIEELCFSEELVKTRAGPLPGFLDPGKPKYSFKIYQKINFH